jgi:xylose isomerase
MITRRQQTEARREATRLIRGAGIVIADEEVERIEVVDFGLSDRARQGIQVLTFFSTNRISAKVLLLLKQVALPATGVTLDCGHALLAQENPAQSIALCAESGVPFYLHTNDNDWKFDWDLAGGSRNFLHYVEFLFYAREYGYDKFFTPEASPRNFDRVEFFTRHIALTGAIWKLVEGLDRRKYRKLMEEEKAMDLLALVQKEIYRL